MIKRVISLVILGIFIMTMPVSSEEISDEIASEEWYDNWSLDSDGNRIDDRLEEEIEKAGYSGEYCIFIDYRRPPSLKDVEFLENLGLEINYMARYMPTIAAQNANCEDVVMLASLPDVAMIELDYPISPFLDVSTPAVKARGSSFYSPETAWEEGYTGRDIVIAILDTGVDDNHESLDGKFVAGVDVSNQGFNINGNPDDGNGHGSHCAGTAMGNGGATDEDSDGEADYKGTAPDALLVDVKIGTDLGGNLGNSIIRGIEWCREHKDDYDIRILSISWGSTAKSDGQDATSRAVNEAVLEDGLIIVAAAGNQGNEGFGGPAAADEAITIGAVEDQETVARGDDTVAGYSNRGPRQDDEDDDHVDELKPDLCAPGTDIMSVRYSEIGQGNPNVQGQYQEMSGTSMACPHISGIVALMLEANPGLTPGKVKDILHKTADKRGEPYDENLSEKYNTAYGWGITDAYKAVRAALGHEPLNEEIEIDISDPEAGDTVSGNIKILGTATVSGNMTVESVNVLIDGELHDAQGTENWYYVWDTRDVENGNCTITVQATAENGSKEASVSITVFVNNSGEKDVDGQDEILGLEENEFYLASGVTICVIAIAATGITLRRSRKIRGETDEDELE